MNTKIALDRAKKELDKTFSGPLLVSGESGYEEVRKLHNGMVDRRPAIIAQCRTVADIVDAVNFAQHYGLKVAIRGGGHNVAGLATIDGGLMIDLSIMKGVYVDPKNRTVRAQGGVTWGEFNRETQLHGLATTGGTVSTTGIAGLTLGGGFGWLMGQYGLAVDNLLSAEVVTVDGEVVNASEDENTDLFWGIRGGGGNFGVAASLEYNLHNVGPTVTGGQIVYPFESARELLQFYRDTTTSLPAEMSLAFGFLTAPDDPQTKLAGLLVAHCGALDDGRRELEPILEFGSPLMNTVGAKSYCDLNTMLDPLCPRGVRCYWKSTFLSELSDEAIQVMIDAYADCPSPMSVLIIEHWHGATRFAVDAKAFPHRYEGYNFLMMSQWEDPVDDDRCISWTRELYDVLTPFMITASYANYLNLDEDDAVARAFGSNYARLQAVKQKWDPQNFFRMNQNIRPAP